MPSKSTANLIIAQILSFVAICVTPIVLYPLVEQEEFNSYTSINYFSGLILLLAGISYVLISPRNLLSWILLLMLIPMLLLTVLTGLKYAP
ncbi:hypothetical protein [Rubritalea sp.]|uniref:hypothetical protein n=1 Tax=Rubritalea sp. TaxID=2109375 RepID=UPI003EF79798